MFDSYAEIFAERARDYHAAMVACPNARDSEFQAVLEPLAACPDGLLCDIPSGGGYLAPYLKPGMRYLGVEPARDFLDASPAALERVHGDITSVPLPDQTVDYVVSLAGLHHEPGLERVFGEMRRLVRPGGRVVIADVAEGTAPARFLNGFVADNNPLGHDGRFLDDGTAHLLEEAEFAVSEDKLIDVPWTFESHAQAGSFCRQLFGTTALTAEQVADALAEWIGFDKADGQPRLRWQLRRIVADAR